MIVSIFSENMNVKKTLLSVAKRFECEAYGYDSYNPETLKTSDYCIFDLDNLSHSIDKIKEDAPNFSDVVVLGLSKNELTRDMFRPILVNVEEKPFIEEVFLQYKSLVTADSDLGLSITKDKSRIYDACGVKVGQLLDDSLLEREDYIERLLAKIGKSKTEIKTEDEFFEDIEIKDIPVAEPVVTPPVVVYSDPFEDKALLMYRTRKLKNMNLTKAQIEERLRILTERSVLERANPTKTSTSSSLIDKLKSGYFRGKPKPKELPIEVPPEKPKAPPQQEVVKEEVPEKEEPVKEEFSDLEKQFLLDEPEVEVKQEETKKEFKPSWHVEEDDSRPVRKPVRQNISNTGSSDSKLDVTLDADKQALLDEKLARLKAKRRAAASAPPPPPPQKEPVVNIPPPPVPENVRKKEEVEDAFGLNKALTSLGGGKAPVKNKPVGKPIKQNSEEPLQESLPSTSLFDKIRESVQARAGEDHRTLKEKRKEEIDKKSRPPRR